MPKNKCTICLMHPMYISLYKMLSLFHNDNKDSPKTKLDAHFRMSKTERKQLVEGPWMDQRSIEMEKQHLSPGRQVYHIPFASLNKCILNRL